MINSAYATILAKEILKEHPFLILCGSLALIIKNELKFEQVGDIDFVCYKHEFDPINMEVDTERYPPKINEGGKYLCYKILFGTSYYNVFTFDPDYEIKYTLLGDIKIQDSEQILHYKKLYSRQKDINHLYNMVGSNKYYLMCKYNGLIEKNSLTDIYDYVILNKLQENEYRIIKGEIVK